MYHAFRPALELAVASAAVTPGCCCEDGCTLGAAEVGLERGREFLVLLHTVEGDLGCDIVDDFLGCLCFCKAAVFLRDVVETV